MTNQSLQATAKAILKLGYVDGSNGDGGEPESIFEAEELLTKLLESVVPERKNANENMDSDFGAARQALADGFDECIEEIEANISKLGEDSE